ncbi:MAG: hypothetical protein DRO18_06970 [Thermoprotei archaeon]|nr:MAG: hypothetical protein DRO18_06970 [Thermoprotei archaeon]
MIGYVVDFITYLMNLVLDISMGKVFIGLIRDHRTRIGRIKAFRGAVAYGHKGKVKDKERW